MEVKEVLFTNKGEGENSFLQNSGFTQALVIRSKPTLEKAVESLFTEKSLPFEVLNAADLGCSSNQTSCFVMSTVIQTVESRSKTLNCKIPEFQFYLNDLPGNDFNTLFQGLTGFVGEKNKHVSCFVMGAPGSFYGRLFPRNSMHLVHCCYGAHWLSKVPELKDKEGLPINKGNIYISKTSPAAAVEAYLAQFQQDFSLFLKLRGQEMVPDIGCLFLILCGRPSADPTNEDFYNPINVIGQALSDLVSKGVIDEEKLDSFDVPCYVACKEEVKEIVEMEGSFEVDFMETFAMDSRDHEIWSDEEQKAKSIRPYTEPMISSHFGEEILDELYDKVTDMVVEDYVTRTLPDSITNIVVVLKRKKEH